MANDWIKFTKGLEKKREVVAMAVTLKPTGNHRFDRMIVACAWMMVWAWADSETTDGHISGVTGAVVDEEAGLPGFFGAAETVGWASSTERGITFHNWARHNGETAKMRARNAANQNNRRLRRPLSGSVAIVSPCAGDIHATPSSLLLSSGSLPSRSEGGWGETSPPAPPGQIRPHFDVDPPVLSHWMASAKRVYALYPRQMGGRAAVSAFAVALQVIADRGERDPEAWMSASVRAFSEAVKGKAPDFIPSPANWARDRRYDDDHAKVYGAEITPEAMSADLEAALNAGRKA